MEENKKNAPSTIEHRIVELNQTVKKTPQQMNQMLTKHHIAQYITY